MVYEQQNHIFEHHLPGYEHQQGLRAPFATIKSPAKSP